MAGSLDKFVESVSEEEWRQTLQMYSKVLHKKSGKKTKAGAAEELTRLDQWYQTDLPERLQEREQKHMTLQELVELVKWKLSRGKFRPRLVQLAGSNKEEEVVRRSQAAFQALDSGGPSSLGRAIQELSALKGIGPATASAILAAGCPDFAAFMSDEAVLSLLGPVQLKYTPTEYMEYMEEVRNCVKTLRRQNGRFGWRAQQVELVLWTRRHMDLFGLTAADLAPQ